MSKVRAGPLTLALSRHPLHWEEQRVPGRGDQKMCPSPGCPLGVGEGTQGVPGEGVSWIW